MFIQLPVRARPSGSSNGLALHLGLPLLLHSALELASGTNARLSRIDAAMVNGRPFFNAMGLGLDAEVSHRFNGLTRRGLPAYVRTAWQAWREVRGETVTLESAELRCVAEVLLLAIANSDQYGNNARIAPGARVDDGALDLVAIRPLGIVAAAAIAGRLFLGNLAPNAKVLRWRGPRFSIQRATGGLIHTDGEPFTAGARLDVEVLPRSLRVLVAATSHAVRDAASEECSDPLAFTAR